MKIVMTGANGFIGRPMLRLFLSSGFDVVTLNRSKNVGECPNHIVDLMDRDSIRRVLLKERPTHLVHLAWYTEHNKFWNSSKNFSWVLATKSLIEEFILAGGESVAAAGTCAEYAPSNSAFINESHDINPTTTYGICKHLTHMLARQQLENCGGKLAWFRIFFPYGAGDKSSRLVPTLHKINAGLTPPITVDKSSVRDFVHVNDIAEAFKCLVSGNCDGIFNLCSGTAVAIGDLVDAVAVCYDKPVDICSSEKSQKI